MPITPTPFPTSTAAPLPTPYPTLTPNPTGTAMPVPTDPPLPTLTPNPTATVTATAVPVPTDTPLPTLTPNPTATGGPVPTDTPLPTLTPNPTATVTATAMPVPTDTPLPTLAPNPTGTAMPVPTDPPLPTLPPPPTLPPAPTLAPIPVQQFVWGQNTYGGLGIGTTKIAMAATPMGNPGEYAEMQFNNGQGGFLKYDGSLWLAGINNVGQLGNGTLISASSPVQEISESDWLSFSVLVAGVMGVKDDGSLWAWGGLQYVNQPRFLNSKPVQIGTDEDWATVGGGRDAYYAIKKNGSMYSMGKNTYGQLGIGNGASNTATALSPTPIMSGTTDWSNVYGTFGGSAFALKTDGRLYGWGYNGAYQLGDGTTANRFAPVHIGSGITFTDISVGNSVGLASDGSIYGWGGFSNGSMDNGVVNGRYSLPTQISSGNHYDFLSTSYLATDVIQSGTLYTVGSWSYGELATSGLIASGYSLRTSFAPVPGSYSWVGLADVGEASLCGGFAVLPTATPSPTNNPAPSPTPPVFLMIPFNFNFFTETSYPCFMGFTFGNSEVTNDILKIQYVSNETKLTVYSMEISNSSEYTVYVNLGNDTYALAPFTQGNYELPMIFGSVLSIYCEGNVTIPIGLVTGSFLSL